MTSPPGLGECFRFNGNGCRHYTEPNASGATRVSFDLRMLPVSLQQAAAVPPQRGESEKVKIGDYDTAIARQLVACVV